MIMIKINKIIRFFYNKILINKFKSCPNHKYKTSCDFQCGFYSNNSILSSCKGYSLDEVKSLPGIETGVLLVGKPAAGMALLIPRVILAAIIGVAILRFCKEFPHDNIPNIPNIYKFISFTKSAVDALIEYNARLENLVKDGKVDEIPKLLSHIIEAMTKIGKLTRHNEHYFCKLLSKSGMLELDGALLENFEQDAHLDSIGPDWIEAYKSIVTNISAYIDYVQGGGELSVEHILKLNGNVIHSLDTLRDMLETLIKVNESVIW